LTLANPSRGAQEKMSMNRYSFSAAALAAALRR